MRYRNQKDPYANPNAFLWMDCIIRHQKGVRYRYRVFILTELTPSEALYIKSRQNALHPILISLQTLLRTMKLQKYAKKSNFLFCSLSLIMAQ